MGEPGFWDNAEAARIKVAELKAVKALVTPHDQLTKGARDCAELAQLADGEGDTALLDSVGKDLDSLEHRLEHYETQVLLDRPDDPQDAFVSIHAGAGGTDACDWVEILFRMYRYWLTNSGYALQVLDEQEGEEAGLRQVTLEVKGDYAYGFLKAEIGVHRLVRISPYDANKRRHTSFASVDVLALVEDARIDINEADLKIDTYRAGGKGGQHVNKTESAIRITHLPTGVVVACQNERSQHANRKVAMQMLAAKLRQLQERARESELQKAYSEKGEIAWGYQIRSYTMQPYQLVKDHRTDVETGNIQAVLDGGLDRFVTAYLRDLRRERQARGKG